LDINRTPDESRLGFLWRLWMGLAFVLLFLSGSSFAQNFKRQYREARDYFEKGDYTRSMDGFKPLIEYDQENPYAQYASYYYGFSAAKLGFATVAKDILLQTRKLYPGWDQIDEVNYLLAKIYFDQHEYFRAMLILTEIKNLSMAVDVTTMKRHYLAQITDVETLRMMMEEYPAEAEAARALVKAISLQPMPEQDGRLFDSLIIKFNFDRKDFVTDNTLISRKKDRYAVSLLLPFLANTLDPSPVKKRNQYVLDLYVGMKMAADTLAKQGIYLDLYAYDTERSAETTKRILGMEELKSTDLLVGPLFPDQSKTVLEFSEKNKISMINPVSNNSEFIGQNPFALLYQPTHETLGMRSAERVASQVKNKNCIVYFSENPKDSAKASSFMKKAIELGIKIVWAEEIRKETSGKIFSFLATGTEYDEYHNPTQFTLKLDSIGSIYVATDDPVIYTKVISGVETRGDSILIVGNESWIAQDNTTVDYGIYDRLQILLEAPNFTPSHDPVYLDFRRKYIRQHGAIPSDYARLGYDFIQFVGQALHRYGVYFQIGLAQESGTVDPLTMRYNFKNARDNQQVPYVSFQSGELVPLRNK
jgi:tetratricopeptide (TPR) repeat protein